MCDNIDCFYRDAEDAVSKRDGYDYDGYRLRVEFPRGGTRGRSGGGGGSGGRGGDGRGRGAPARRSQYRVMVSGTVTKPLALQNDDDDDQREKKERELLEHQSLLAIKNFLPTTTSPLICSTTATTLSSSGILLLTTIIFTTTTFIIIIKLSRVFSIRTASLECHASSSRKILLNCSAGA